MSGRFLVYYVEGECGNYRNQPWVLTKSSFLPNSQSWRDQEMSRKLKKSFVGHPSAILFLLIPREGLSTATWLTQSSADGKGS
jgi:hypothetical protein